MNPALETNSIRELFNALGSESEKFREGYFVLDVPFGVSYRPVKTLLNELLSEGSIEYAEACLSDKHLDDEV
jgi:hypothetical protein